MKRFLCLLKQPEQVQNLARHLDLLPKYFGLLNYVHPKLWKIQDLSPYWQKKNTWIIDRFLMFYLPVSCRHAAYLFLSAKNISWPKLPVRLLYGYEEYLARSWWIPHFLCKSSRAVSSELEHFHYRKIHADADDVALSALVRQGYVGFNCGKPRRLRGCLCFPSSSWGNNRWLTASVYYCSADDKGLAEGCWHCEFIAKRWHRPDEMMVFQSPWQFFLSLSS